MHFSSRLATVLGQVELRYVEAELSSTSANSLSGSIVVFTDVLVAVASLTNTTSTATAYRSDGSSIELEVFPRSALQTLQIPREACGREVNRDEAWSPAMSSGWPRDGVVSLHYPHRILTLNGQSDREGMLELLPSLLLDLARPAS
jgi:hypothetical protein